MEFKINYSDYRDKASKHIKILYNFHKLNNKEMEILSEIVALYTYYKEKYDATIADTLIFNTDSRNIIKERLNNMSDPVFQNYLSSLRKKGIIKDGKIFKAMIPPSEDFDLTFKFTKKQ